MNKSVSLAGSGIVCASVFLFAMFLIVDFIFGAFFVCMFLPIGYIMMSAGFHHEAAEDRKVPATVGMILAAVYAVFICIVYFAQTTSVRLDELNEQSQKILNFKRGVLIFNYDLFGYGMMALSTFFIGLSINAKSKCDRWLKILMMVHGLFFICCFILPMTGIFKGMSNGKTSMGGTIALVIWCFYFLPIGVLSFIHFKK